MKRHLLKTLIALALVAAFLCPALPQDMARADGTLVMYVQTGNSGRLHLRKLPNTKSESLGLYKNGTPVAVESMDGIWAYVRVDGKAGYMKQEFLTVLPDGSSAYTPTAAPETWGNGIYYIRTNDGGKLNLREQPSTSARSLGLYPVGTPVYVSGRVNDWAMVAVDGRTGYMLLSCLSVTAPGAPTPAPTSAPAPDTTLQPGIAVTRYVKTGNSGKLNLRQLPDRSSKSLGLYPNGTAVQAVDLRNGWSQVAVDGKLGYMMTKYLAEKSAAPTAKPTAAPTASPADNMPVITVMYINTGNSGKLYLREAPNTSAKSLGLYENGTTVLVHANFVEWMYVTVNGKTGYMQSKYLTYVIPAVTPTPAQAVTPAPTLRPGPTAQPKYATVIHPSGSFVYLRSYASTTAENILDKIPSGTVVEVISWGEYWCRVRVNGQVGYMVTEFLK